MYLELSTIEKQLSNVLEGELGSEERPARSCYDLKLEMPQAKSGTYVTNTLELCYVIYSTMYVGMYFIDPNLGSPEDGIKTYCNFDSSLTYTCVQVQCAYNLH